MAEHILAFTTDTPYLAVTGELWGVFCEKFGENWLLNNGTTLYFDATQPQCPESVCIHHSYQLSYTHGKRNKCHCSREARNNMKSIHVLKKKNISLLPSSKGFNKNNRILWKKYILRPLTSSTEACITVAILTLFQTLQPMGVQLLNETCNPIGYVACSIARSH